MRLACPSERDGRCSCKTDMDLACLGVALKSASRSEALVSGLENSTTGGALKEKAPFHLQREVK